LISRELEIAQQMIYTMHFCSLSACLRAVHGSQTQKNNTNVDEGNEPGRYPTLAPPNGGANQLSMDVAKITMEQVQ
jgi:hypothetical protein